MNKRQAKKAAKKVVYPLVDEFNLLTMDNEERKAAIDDFNAYAQKHYRYFHYKDKYKKVRTPCYYCFPVGKKYAEQLVKMTDLYRSQKPSGIVISQSIQDLTTN